MVNSNGYIYTLDIYKALYTVFSTGYSNLGKFRSTELHDDANNIGRGVLPPKQCLFVY